MRIVQLRRRQSGRPLRTRKVSFYVTEDQARRLSQLTDRRYRTVAAYLQRLLTAGRQAWADGAAAIKPRRPQHPPRDTQMGLRVTEAQHKTLDREAHEAGL